MPRLLGQLKQGYETALVDLTNKKRAGTPITPGAPPRPCARASAVLQQHLCVPKTSSELML